MLVMSFHGVPERTLHLGDPYHCELPQDGAAAGRAAGLGARTSTASPSRAASARRKWLQPYTEPTLQQLAREGVERVDVICPGFVADCLETLEEIDQEAREAFLAAGGKTFHYIACLNDRHEWIAALRDIALRHLQGWDTQAAPDAAALEAQRRARAGAGRGS